MKKRIVLQNSTPAGQSTKAKGADRQERLGASLRDNLKKRKAQARVQTEAKKTDGSN